MARMTRDTNDKLDHWNAPDLSVSVPAVRICGNRSTRRAPWTAARNRLKKSLTKGAEDEVGSRDGMGDAENICIGVAFTVTCWVRYGSYER